MKIKLENFNHYGFLHEKVNKNFEGDLTYVGTFCINDSNFPWAVYHNANPNREKNHCDYMLLTVNMGFANNTPNVVISGLNAKDIEPYRYQSGLQCNHCNDIIYSVYRHDFRECQCGKCAIDGGRDYLHITGNKDDYTFVTIDLIKGETKENL